MRYGGAGGLAVEATRILSRRKCIPLAYEQKFEKARVKDERRSVIKLTLEQKSKKARVDVERWSAIKLIDEQKFEKAIVEVERRGVIKLTIAQKLCTLVPGYVLTLMYVCVHALI
jgi:hypothetical protein